MQTSRPSRILIIDDNVIDRDIYKRCFRESAANEFEFAEADCAQMGIEMARAWRPDCALLDVNLPDMDGIEALNHLGGGSGRIPFAAVVLTAFSAEAVAVRAIRAGAMDYLPKAQVSAGTLPRAVQNAIERFHLQERIEEQRHALEKSVDRYRVLVEAIPQMVWMVNSEGVLEYANRRWLEYIGLTLADGAVLEWDGLVHTDDRAETMRAWDQAKREGTIFEIEHRLRRAADGGYRWHLVRAIPTRGSAGEITNWFGTCTEIEDQRQAGIANLEKQKFESLGRMAGGLAHDFNNLLVTILCGASYAMERLPARHPSVELMQGVIQAGEHAAEITRKMLAYAGKSNIRSEEANLGELVEAAIPLAAVPKTIRVEFKSEGRIPPVETDTELLRQTVIDLIRNAVEAIGEGRTGVISVRITPLELKGIGAAKDPGAAGGHAGRYASIEVRDTGCGMDVETQRNMFDPFFTTKFPGRGLGLAAVRGFVESSGGSVQVESAPGKGTRLQLLLPAVSESASIAG